VEKPPTPPQRSSTTPLLGEGVSTDHLPQVCGNPWRETPGILTVISEGAPGHMMGLGAHTSAAGRVPRLG